MRCFALLSWQRGRTTNDDNVRERVALPSQPPSPCQYGTAAGLPFRGSGGGLVSRRTSSPETAPERPLAEERTLAVMDAVSPSNSGGGRGAVRHTRYSLYWRRSRCRAAPQGWGAAPVGTAPQGRPEGNEEGGAVVKKKRQSGRRLYGREKREAATARRAAVKATGAARAKMTCRPGKGQAPARPGRSAAVCDTSDTAGVGAVTKVAGAGRRRSRQSANRATAGSNLNSGGLLLRPGPSDCPAPLSSQHPAPQARKERRTATHAENQLVKAWEARRRERPFGGVGGEAEQLRRSAHSSSSRTERRALETSHRRPLPPQAASLRGRKVSGGCPTDTASIPCRNGMAVAQRGARTFAAILSAVLGAAHTKSWAGSGGTVRGTSRTVRPRLAARFMPL